LVKVEVPRTAYAEETMRVLRGCGCLLVSGDTEESNVMTIGWGLIGPIWSRPFFVVAVRPSRHTYKFIEKTGDFTVNVPKKGMEEIADYCGSVSGRDYNKFKEKNLTLRQGKNISSPIILECGIHYECKVSYKTKIAPRALPQDIITTSYPSGDYHTLYFGEILSSYADRNIRDLL
jgi:flavin reductase (DIM6/NTAB) family NADH-FMN oxidoreductase RutF